MTAGVYLTAEGGPGEGFVPDETSWSSYRSVAASEALAKKAEGVLLMRWARNSSLTTTPGMTPQGSRIRIYRKLSAVSGLRYCFSEEPNKNLRKRQDLPRIVCSRNC